MIETGGDENSIKAAYVRFRIQELEAEHLRSEDARFALEQEARFCDDAIADYGETHLARLEWLLESGDEASILETRDQIYRKSGRVPRQDDALGFLRAVHSRLTERLRSERGD